MNGLYGKYGEKPQREVSNFVTDNEDLLIDMFSKGLLHDVK